MGAGSGIEGDRWGRVGGKWRQLYSNNNKKKRCNPCLCWVVLVVTGSMKANFSSFTFSLYYSCKQYSISLIDINGIALNNHVLLLNMLYYSLFIILCYFIIFLLFWVIDILCVSIFFNCSAKNNLYVMRHFSKKRFYYSTSSLAFPPLSLSLTFLSPFLFKLALQTLAFFRDFLQAAANYHRSKEPGRAWGW